MVPADHPLRTIRSLCDECIKPLMSAGESQYSSVGQPGVPPAVLLRSVRLQALYSIRIHRALCEQIQMNHLFRWFVGLDWDDAVFDHSVLTKNRDRLFANDATQAFLGEVVQAAESKNLLTSDRMVAHSGESDQDSARKRSSFRRKAIRFLDAFRVSKCRYSDLTLGWLLLESSCLSL